MIPAVFKWVPCTQNWEYFTKLEHFVMGHLKKKLEYNVLNA